MIEQIKPIEATSSSHEVPISNIPVDNKCGPSVPRDLGKDLRVEDGIMRYHARKTSNGKGIKQYMSIIRENEKAFACFLSESAHGGVLGECETSHWFLFAVDLVKQNIVLLDSMRNERKLPRKKELMNEIVRL
ncbi:hypothetical protein M9H77_29569 [Catharanthus roseus]|uniref:Uncharacterized protein n=1 Tax=Catharanthus roseus TaxID=4058 RepID=A0ACB9ZXE2_CATRO|nr:hypothetical protein M9H77_29569 [Catharanthus roseus]